MQRNTGYFPTESLEPSGNRLFSRSALNEGYLFRGSLDRDLRYRQSCRLVRYIKNEKWRMKMMKRFTSIVLAMLIVVCLFAGCAGSAPRTSQSAGVSQPEGATASVPTVGGRTYRVLSGYNDSEATMQIFNRIVKKYQDEVNPDFEIELEIIPNTNELWEKIRLYLQADNLPDIFSLSNGPIAEEMIGRDLLLNMGDVLKETGHYNEMSKALIDFFTSKDGNLYMIPSSRSGEFFVYRKSVFEQYNLEIPTTWAEFLNVCQTLKDNGEIVYLMRGNDAVMYIRFLSFPTWTNSGGEFITSLISQDIQYQDNDAAMYAANLLQTLGTSDYFIPGYESLSMGDCIDTFLGGTGAMTYANTGFIHLMKDQYADGEIGFFGVPVVEGLETTGSIFPQHGGKSWAFNKDSYKDDPVLQDFVKFYLDNVDAESYANGALSWMDTPIPDGALDSMTYDVGLELQKQTVGWVSWDDKLQPATLTTVSDSAEKLAKGAMGIEEFAETFNEAIADNNG